MTNNKLRQARIEKLSQIQRIKETLQSQLTTSSAERQAVYELESVALGLYEELDKLTKKSPAESVTDFVLSQLNDVIRETKKLARSDDYVQKLNEIVAAGDNPEQRDALVMLRQARQGLDRYKMRLEGRSKKSARQLNEAQLIERALQNYLADGPTIQKKSSDISNSDWFSSDYPHDFDFRRLDSTDIPSYFLTSSE